jgi:hypothetical protein
MTSRSCPREIVVNVDLTNAKLLQREIVTAKARRSWKLQL